MAFPKQTSFVGLGGSMDEEYYAVKCPACGVVELSPDEFEEQMEDADDEWYCPRCLNDAVWIGWENEDEDSDVPFF